MNYFVKKAIEDNIMLIEEECFDELYSKLKLGFSTGEFTKTLLQAKVLVIDKLSKVPEYFYHLLMIHHLK